MQNTEYNQRLVKKAQAGLVRFQQMQKSALVGGGDPGYMEPVITGASTIADDNKPANPYLQYAAGGAGIGALVGTLVNLVRNKSLLSGALSGALVGGGLGAGHQALRKNVEGYADNNPIDPLISKGKDWYNKTFG